VLGVHLGITSEVFREASKSFKGVKRRQEIVGESGGILILDDFAHHPTSVRETLSAVKERHGGRRVVAVFEPRSNSSRRNTFQREYAASFDNADLVLIRIPSMLEKIPVEERFSAHLLVRHLTKRRLAADSFGHTDQLLNALLGNVAAGDVVVIMSNGSFDNLPQRLFHMLEERR
jgi:UDP-N-acetylmuramate: L-alanyl-gamma-D-glutamyl-meso-diaminopimelate ligase